VNYESLQDAEMRALARVLGTEAAARLDLESTAQAVVRRLRTSPGAAAPRSLPAWLSVAAAVVLMVGGGLVWRSMRTGVPASAFGPAGLDLNSLSADQLNDVFNAVDQPLDVEATGTAETGLDDLTPRELHNLLRTLEGQG